MRKQFIDDLASGNWITGEQQLKIKEWLQNKPFSLHWELRSLLYAGVLLLATGTGFIIYDNIDTIGHTVIIFLIAAACTGCFYYCFTNKSPYTHRRVTYVSPWFDYVLLLGCLLFLALEGYLQFQYRLFGTSYGLAALIPAVVFFYLAYTFDHAGVLSMGITGLASFAGISISPGIISGNQFSEASLIYTGATLAVVLIGTGYLMKEKDIKKHFTFTWYNFGFNLFFMSMLAAIFTLDLPYAFLGLHLLGCLLLLRYAIYEKSFYFLLLTVVYAYIGITWAVFQLGPGEMSGLYYFVVSCVGVIWFFLSYKKILKIEAK